MTDRTVVYRLQADVQQFKAQMATAGASVKKAADDMTAGTKEGDKFRKGLDSLGGAAGKVGLVAAAGLGAAVIKAANFDQAMSNVQAATHESAAAMDSLRQAALDAGADTAFSATEAAAGIENLAKAGVSTAEILDGGLSGALDLAAAGGMEVADAAEAAAGAMAQFGLDGDQVPHIADLMASAAGKAQGEVSDFTMALKQGGTVAAQTGLTLEETTGALAAMAEQSLLGSDAGTSFKTMLSSLTPNSDKAAEAMAQYNIHAFDAQGNFVGMTELAGQLQAGLGDLTDEQRAMALETIFGSDAVRAASIIYDNGAEGIADWTAKVNDAGFAAETAAIKQDNLRGDIEKLGGALETALIGTGDGSQGMLRGLTQGLTGTIDAYNELGEGAKSGVAITLAATAGLGGGLFVFSRMVQSIAATREAMEALGLTSQKTQGMVAAAAKGMGVALAAGLAIAASDLGDTDYSLDQINRQLELLATQGDAEGVLEGLGFSIGSVGEALRDAAFNDFNMFGMGTAQEIEEIDAALSGLEPDVAAAAFKVLSEEGTKAGLTVAEVKDLFPQYAAELKLAAKEAEAAAGSDAALADVHPELSKRISKTTAQLKAEAEALEDARKAARETASSFVNLGEGVNDAEVSLSEWTRQMAKQADALNNFMDNAKKASKRGLRDGLINDLQDAGTAGALRMKQLSNATDEEIAKANRAWKRGQDAMERYVNFKVPPKRLDVETGPALNGIAALEARLRAIKDEDVFVNIRHRNGPNTSGFGPQSNAAGGFITGPGTATSDSIPSYLSNGEYVVKAAAVDKYGVHMFDSLNAMHFASGGSVDKDKKKRKRTFNGEQIESEFNNQLSEQAAAQAAEAAEMFYAEQERAQREADRRAEEAAQRQKDYDDAVLAGHERAWEQASREGQERVDLAQSELDAVESSMKRIGDAATSAFNSPLFSQNQQRGLWAGGAGTGSSGWRDAITGDISGLSERSGLIAQLSSQGLNGAALEALLGQSNNEGIAAMLANGEIADYAALFAQRAALQESVGQQAGFAGYGAEYGSAQAVMAQATSQLAALTSAINAARQINIIQQTTEQAAAMELARILAMAGAS